ncbi:MAG: AAA family ATPase [Chitinophagaceae bacterium]|nr:AAA family ATPase [Chitinophagaceae bacterium]
MESILSVKNFGPIKEVKLNLKNVNVFIGPQATGKSALAKVFTIFKAPRKFFYKKEAENQEVVVDSNKKISEDVVDVFKEYNIYSFINKKTEIEFESELHKITYKNGNLNYEAKLLKQINDLEILAAEFDFNRKEIVSKFSMLASKFVLFDIRAERVLYSRKQAESVLYNNWEKDLTEDKCKDLFEILKPIEDDLSTSTAVYIPAERNFVNIIKKSALNLILNKVPIPKHILSFGAELEKLDLKEIDLGFIQKDLMYKVIDGEDRIYVNSKQTIALTEAASGIQSVVPLLASTFVAPGVVHRSFVIEEPELNLFPQAQYYLIEFLESKRTDPHGSWEDYGTIHTYTTHSPYILSSLNNLLYAYKVKSILNSRLSQEERVGNGYKINEEVIGKIVKATINPKTFTAYQISNGVAESIFNEETGLISDNFIDMASDKVDDDFNELMELLK